MSEKSSVTVSGGFGLGSMAFLVAAAFIIMKCTEYGPVAAWSWFWVFSPIWMWFLFLIGMIAIFFLFLCAIAIFAAIFGDR